MKCCMLSFFVKGRPQPEAKKRIRRGETQWHRPRLHRHDDDGSKRGWMENVRLCARKAMHAQKVKIIPAKVGVTVEYHFYFRQAPSNNDDAMVIKPDSSRLAEAIDDALEGVCYYNDCQIDRCLGRDKHYTTDGQAEGVLIEVYESVR